MTTEALQTRPSTPNGAAVQDLAFQVAVGGLDFQTYTTSDPAPAGLQILQAAALHPAGAFSLLAILPSGDFEDVRPAEPFDLRGRGVERFIAFRTDRLYRFSLVDAAILWGEAQISGHVLRQLARPAEGEALYLEVPGGEDRHLGEGDVLDLSAPDVERVVLGPHPTATFRVEVIYNGVEKPFTVRRNEQVKRLLDAALAAFAPLPNPHTLSIWKGGEELSDGATIGQSGVMPRDKLLLRPSKVKGGR
jgi:hypothetical protein